MTARREGRAKRKQRIVRLRFRGNDPGHNLLAAAQHFILANGGTAVLIGGIEIQQWPGDLPAKYKVSVSAIGRKPTKDKAP